MKNRESVLTILIASILKTYIDNYALLLNNTNVNGDAATYDDLITVLRCSRIDNTCNNSTYSWVKDTTFWSSYSSNSTGVWRVNSEGEFNYDHYSSSSFVGVRPVIIFSESSI